MLEPFEMRLLSAASHDIRAAIANSLAYCSLLLSPKATLDDRARRQVEVILRNSEKALSLLQDLIDSWMATSGTLIIDPSEMEIIPLIEEAIARCQRLASEKGIQLHRSLPSSGPRARVDRARFVHAVAAFLENGMARSVDGGPVQLAAGLSATDHLRLAVTDHGKALDSIESNQYFDQDRALAAEGKLGARFRLGLAGAEIRAHGGEVGIVAEPGGGTTFFFTLPVC